jgi:hypothetical protein
VRPPSRIAVDIPLRPGGFAWIVVPSSRLRKPLFFGYLT